MLNDEQKMAVTSGDGPVLVLAGAGSGKTRVLTRRIVYLVTEQNIRPDQILAVTFTNKAAGEMRARVEKLTGVPASEMWISTFHSFSLKMLRKHAVQIGYKNQFVIFDSADQLSLIKSCLKVLNISEEMISPSAAINRISRAKDENILPKEFELKASDIWSRTFSRVYSLYQAELKKQNAMDFGDLLVNMLRLIDGNAGILEYYQNKFKYVLVDEYQDTNHVQYKLVKLLSAKHKNLFVVGDEDQSIYRWRGADIKNILDFKKDFTDATVVKLEQNYRSTPTILNAANSLIKRNKGRLGKNLWTARQDNDAVKIVQKLGDIDEAKYVANRIYEIANNGSRYDDMAIFYRTNAQSRVIEECFRNSGIPYIIYGGVKFYERMEIKDVLAYLQLTFDSANDIAFLRIVNRPTRGIGKTTIDKIKGFAREQSLSLYEASSKIIQSDLLTAKAAKFLAKFVELINKFKEKLCISDLGDFVNFVLDESGYIGAYKNSKSFDAPERLENIREFLRATYDFKVVAEKGLPEFLDQVALVSDVDSMDGSRGVVPLMTLHLSKGLEFPVVFMMGLEEGLFPHSRSMNDDDELEEERRLCYVGMTRAMEKLHMTYCSKRRLFGKEQYNLPSRFLDEIDAKYVERENVSFAAAPTRYGHKKSSGPAYKPEPMFINQSYVDQEFDQRSDYEKSKGLFNLGTKVEHSVFGQGTIRKIEGAGDTTKVMVQFDSGKIKTLVVKYAQLKIVH